MNPKNSFLMVILLLLGLTGCQDATMTQLYDIEKVFDGLPNHYADSCAFAKLNSMDISPSDSNAFAFFCILHSRGSRINNAEAIDSLEDYAVRYYSRHSVGNERQAGMAFYNKSRTMTSRSIMDASRLAATARQLFRKCNDSACYVYCCSRLAYLDEMRGDLDLAISHVRETLPFLVFINDSMRRAESYSGLGRIYATNGMPDSAEHFARISLSLCRRPLIWNGAYLTLANVSLARDDFELAISFCDSLAYLNQRQSMRRHNVLARAYLALGDTERALAHYDSIVPMDLQQDTTKARTGTMIYTALGMQDSVLACNTHLVSVINQMRDLQNSYTSSAAEPLVLAESTPLWKRIAIGTTAFAVVAMFVWLNANRKRERKVMAEANAVFDESSAYADQMLTAARGRISSLEADLVSAEQRQQETDSRNDALHKELVRLSELSQSQDEALAEKSNSQVFKIVCDKIAKSIKEQVSQILSDTSLSAEQKVELCKAIINGWFPGLVDKTANILSTSDEIVVTYCLRLCDVRVSLIADAFCKEVQTISTRKKRMDVQMKSMFHVSSGLGLHDLVPHVMRGSVQGEQMFALW